MTTAAEIEAAIQRLPRHERKKLDEWFEEQLMMVNASSETLAVFDDEEADEVEPREDWREEIRSRVGDLDEGRTVLVSHDKVMAGVRARIEEVRLLKRES